jgi:hypothetical protein
MKTRYTVALSILAGAAVALPFKAYAQAKLPHMLSRRSAIRVPRRS